MPEQLRRNQRLRDRGAIDTNERTTRPPGATMDRTGDELFTRPGLTLDQNGRVGRRYFRDLSQHRPQRIRRADDFFEHRRAHDLFPQRDILVPRSVFRSFTVVNVRSRRVPADQAPLFVMEGLVAGQEPPILPVLAQGPQLELKRKTICQRRLALVAHAFEIFRVEDSGPKVRADDVGHRQTGVIERRLVRVDRTAVRIENDDVLRYRVSDPAECAFVLEQLRFGLFERVNVSARSVPSDDLARVVADGLEASEKPAKHSIVATKTPFELSALARRHDLGPLFDQLRKVVAVNRRLPTLPARLVFRDTRIVLPTSIHKLVRTIRQLAPGDRREGIENRSTLGCVGMLVAGIRSAHNCRPLSLRLWSRCSGDCRSRSRGSGAGIPLFTGVAPTRRGGPESGRQFVKSLPRSLGAPFPQPATPALEVRAQKVHPLGPRLLTATRSKCASRRCASAHAFLPHSRRTLSCTWDQSRRAASRALLPLDVSFIALMRPSGCGTRSITPSRSRRLRLRVSVVWSMASMSSSCLRFASPRRAMVARMLN